MTSISPCSPHTGPPGPSDGRNWLSRAASAVLDTLREMDYAQRRALANRMSYTGVLPDPSKAPDTYQEFLLRTWSAPLHEPTAGQRADGRQVR